MAMMIRTLAQKGSVSQPIGSPMMPIASSVLFTTPSSENMLLNRME